MKTVLNYQLKLMKDAEPGTGLGGETVNDLIPTDIHGFPVVPASHIRGLMRAALRSIAGPRMDDWDDQFPAQMDSNGKEWPEALIDCVFGCFDDPDSSERCRQVTCRDAMVLNWSADEDHPQDSDWIPGQYVEVSSGETSSTRLISRTAIGPSGVAKSTSLRTTEAVPVGTSFRGTVTHAFESGSVEEIACRLSLIAIGGVGGSRNRGGQCLIELLDSSNQAQPCFPGTLLKELNRAIREKRFSSKTQSPFRDPSRSGDLAEETALVELLFIADAPVCCPELPDKSNVIVSGFSIPASSVQGVLLNRVNEFDPSLATKLYAHSQFRCWPLNPCANPLDRNFSDLVAEQAPQFDFFPNTVRVSLSHRAAKFASSEYTSDHFFEPAFGPREAADQWPEAPDRAPLKASDGVLLFGPALIDGPQLWKSSAMPRYLSAHGVMDGPRERSELASKRNLFSVESMAPLVWRGFVAVPDNIADTLVDSLNSDPEVAIGKRRSVRGSGRLFARRLGQDALIPESSQPCDETVLILQSPALVPAGCSQDGMMAEEVLRKIATPWLKHFQLPPLAHKNDCWANLGIQFGWNRHGKQLTEHGSVFQPAQKVLMPGTVFTLQGKAENPEDLQRAVLAGFYDPSTGPDTGRTRGFGAIAVHPGKATAMYRPRKSIRRFDVHSMKPAMDIVVQMEQLPRLPSSSQIRSVEQQVRTDDLNSLTRARDYLVSQCNRTNHFRYAWEQILPDIDRLLTEFTPEIARKALKSLADIAVSREKDE